MRNVGGNHWLLEGNDCLVDSDDPTQKINAPEMARNESVTLPDGEYQIFYGTLGTRVAVKADTVEEAVSQCGPER